MAASNIVRPQTKNRRAGIWESNPLPRRGGAQENGRIWRSLLPVRITTVDFPVIYGNIAALCAMSDADLRTRITEMMVKNVMLQVPADQMADDARSSGPNGTGRE